MINVVLSDTIIKGQSPSFHLKYIFYADGKKILTEESSCLLRSQTEADAEAFVLFALFDIYDIFFLPLVQCI